MLDALGTEDPYFGFNYWLPEGRHNTRMVQRQFELTGSCR
jgi:hypothetical protein